MTDAKLLAQLRQLLIGDLLNIRVQRILSRDGSCAQLSAYLILEELRTLARLLKGHLQTLGMILQLLVKGVLQRLFRQKIISGIINQNQNNDYTYRHKPNIALHTPSCPSVHES
ncbi:hypothetical protein D3C80_1635720 [compost metagenome]